MYRSWQWRSLTALYMILLTYVSLKSPQEGVEPSTAEQLVHNASHIPAYAILTFLLLKSLRSFNAKIKIGIFFIAFTYGVFMELLQLNIVNRYGSMLDVFLNSMGIILILIIGKNSNK